MADARVVFLRGGSGSDPPDKVRPMAISTGLAAAVAAAARCDRAEDDDELAEDDAVLLILVCVQYDM